MAVAEAVTGIDGGIAGLPDDLLVEVFSRVGSVKSLFLLAVTSRRWLRLFTDPAFLRRLCPGQGQGHRARLLGFFPRQTKPFMDYCRMVKIRMTQHTSVSPPTFVPAPGSPLGSTERALTAFVSDDDGTFNYAKPLAARRGLVLMRLVPRTFDLDQMRMRATATVTLLALCNPITGERHVLPPLLDCSDRRVAIKGYAIVTASDLDWKPRSPSGRFTFSQLLVIATRNKTQEQYLHSYSAATRSWRGAPTMCIDGWRFSIVGHGPAAVHRGVAHWLCFDHIDNRNHLYKLSAEVGTSRVSLAKLPVKAGGRPLLYVSGDGKLSIVCVYLAHATVWTQQQNGEDATWVCTREFQLPVVEPNPNDPPELRRCFDEWHEFDRGSMLVIYRWGGVFVLDIEKEAMEKVLDCFPRLFTNKQHWRCAPYEMDLVEFFMCHLGGLLYV